MLWLPVQSVKVRFAKNPAGWYVKVTVITPDGSVNISSLVHHPPKDLDAFADDLIRHGRRIPKITVCTPDREVSKGIPASAVQQEPFKFAGKLLDDIKKVCNG